MPSIEPKSMSRIHYAIIVVTIIGCGLLSRTISAVPLFVGDMLYAMMMVAIMRWFFVSNLLWKICLWSLMLCFAIECSQLLSYDWLLQLRSTRLGALVLGQGFLWSDIAAYTGGVWIFGMFLSRVERRRDRNGVP